MRDRIVELRRVPAEELSPHPDNWRTHPAQQRSALTAMLDRVGIVDAVIARETDDGLQLVDGHLRTDVLADEQIPVLVVDLDDAEADEVLASLDPLAAMAGRDDDRLRGLLDSFETPLPDMEWGLPPVELPAADDDEVEPVADPVTERGDLWLLGGHRLLCGDSSDPADVERLLAGATPSLMVTDPPYGVDYEPGWRSRLDDGAVKRRLGTVTGDDTADWSATLTLATPFCEVVYCWSPTRSEGLTFARVLEDAGYTIRYMLIWVKNTTAFGRGHYHWAHEGCWYAVRDGATARWAGQVGQSTVWDIPMLCSRDAVAGTDDEWTEHATQKPVECMERPIRNHHGDVYDPFVGSGSTIIAAERQKRRCYAMEIDPGYVDAAVARWERITGGEAERQRTTSSGQSVSD